MQRSVVVLPPGPARPPGSASLRPTSPVPSSTSIRTAETPPWPTPSPISAVSIARAPADAHRVPWGFAEVFVISQTALPALLYLPGTQAFRLPIRFSAFAISLAALAWHQFAAPALPRARAQPWLVAVLSLLALMLFHPQTVTLIGGLAQIGIYLAVIAPIFWAPTFVGSPEQMARLFWILLLCSGANAVVGVLQVYDPARWLPQEFSRLVTQSTIGLGAVTYVGGHGQQIVRPPGLFDTPGAVAGPAMFAALLGLIFTVSPVPFWKRALSLAIAGCGFAAIYLSQVRISLVVAVLMLVVYAFLLFRQGRAARSSQFGFIAAGVLAASFAVALTLGGASVSERFKTLFADDPLAVYQQARGAQLNYTFTELLYEYPFGAGLGRWGMTAGYFGSNDPNIPPIWAEIQFTGWMIDGGVVLIALYLGALAAAARAQFALAQLQRHPRVATCAAVVLAAGLGPAALIISFTPFVAQIGIQYWFLAGALHGAACRSGVPDA